MCAVLRVSASGYYDRAPSDFTDKLGEWILFIEDAETVIEDP
jgi:hypothetical protein